MRFSTAIAVALPIAVAYAETFEVAVGGDSGPVFTPTSVTAEVGDTVNFIFTAGSHTVTRSTFAAPCDALTGDDASDTGIQPVGEVFSFNVTDSAPTWWYCKPHCAVGMVFAINPTAESSFDTFQATAQGEAADGESSSAEGSSSATASAEESSSATPSASDTPASGAVKSGAFSALALVAVSVSSLML